MKTDLIRQKKNLISVLSQYGFQSVPVVIEKLDMQVNQKEATSIIIFLEWIKKNNFDLKYSNYDEMVFKFTVERNTRLLKARYKELVSNKNFLTARLILRFLITGYITLNLSDEADQADNILDKTDLSRKLNTRSGNITYYLA